MIMKQPGESLSEYVRRRMAEEGPMTAAQERAAFIDGNKLHEGAAVVMAIGGGKGNKLAGALGNKGTLIPIRDCTESDEGAGFVIGLGVDTGEARDPPNRSPVATSAPDRPTPKESGARSGSK